MKKKLKILKIEKIDITKFLMKSRTYLISLTSFYSSLVVVL